MNDDIRYLPLVDDVYTPDEDMLLPTRFNEDTVLNEHGKKVIEMCKMCGIRIVNGRLGEISNSTMKTFVGPMGSSTVDLVLCNPKLFDTFENFHISPITEFSDHKYIEFSLKAQYDRPKVSKTSESSRLVWNDEKMNEFVDNIQKDSFSSKLQEMCEVINQNILNESQVHKAISLFSEAIHDAADPLFLKRKNNNLTEHSDPIKDKYPCWATNEWIDAKSNFRRHCDIYHRNPSEENESLMIESRRLYKNLSWQCRRNFDLDQTKKLYNARLKNAKEYWKMIKSVKRKETSNVTCEEFQKYFNDLYNPDDDFYTPDPDVVDRVRDIIDEDIIEMFNVLNVDITDEEVNHAIKELKRNKASGTDCLINELFMYSQKEFTSYITKLFNFVFDSGIFPSNWSEGLLIPIHKKGDLNTPSNFRGIVLLSVLGKLFTRILNTRLNNWAEEYGVYVEAQNGFRKERGTIDNLFILQQLINDHIENGKTLYTFFVDFSKAFDYVVRGNLWMKLLDCGVRGKILKIIMSMYECVKTCIYVEGEKSAPIYSKLGVRQGECLSPFLFAIYVNDLESNLANVDTGIQILHVKLFVLFYADDAVIFANCSEDLQNAIDEFERYCSKWKLKVNTEKSKIVIFKKGRRRLNEFWTYAGNVITISNQINYLGMVISSNGSHNKTQIRLAEQASKAIFSMQRNLNRFIGLRPSLLLELFDKLITPILHYASEVWGFHSAPAIERVHLKFCKRILSVKTSTQNDFIYGELGRMPLAKLRLINILRYWLKIVHGMKSLYVSICYQLGLKNLHERNTSGWVKSVKELLSNCGFADVWFNQGVGDIGIFIKAFKIRIKDINSQEWNARLGNSSRASFYSVYKSTIELSPYLELVKVKNHRESLCRLLTSSHTLHIESGRWNRNPTVPRERRFCFNCISKIEDEFHFVFECPLYDQLRTQLIPSYFRNRPSMYKFIDLLNCRSQKKLTGLAKFVYKANILRSQTLSVR